jgi:hypothetical protein
VTDEEMERVTLRELLIDSVPLPPEPVREAIFERTFAAGAEPGGSELVPPAELFGGVPDSPEPPAVHSDDLVHPDDLGHPDDSWDAGDGLTDDVVGAGEAWRTNGPPLDLPTPEGTDGAGHDPGSGW